MHNSLNAQYGIERVQTLNEVYYVVSVVGRHKLHASPASGAAARVESVMRALTQFKDRSQPHGRAGPSLVL